ncbi:unnamed protein product [Pedinophyceae sp. YPF-701]|nr:unnamed protein product [Pedinophyceae sp. YPF-701]
MADLAKRRAAHFATFGGDGEDVDAEGAAGGNVHTGGDTARSLGPWSSARELVEARQRAAEERGERILEEKRRLRMAAEAGDVLKWEPKRDPRTPRQTGDIRSLFSMCLDICAGFLDCVESLYGIPDPVKVKIAREAARRRMLSPSSLPLFTAGAPAEVVLPNCTEIDPGTLIAALPDCLTPRLRRLELGFCGRPLTDRAASVFLSAAGLEDEDKDGKEDEARRAAWMDNIDDQPAKKDSDDDDDESVDPDEQLLREQEAERLAALPPPGTFPSTPTPLGIEAICLSGAYKLTETGLKRILRACPNLVELRATDCPRITGEIMRALPSLVPRLRVLDVAGAGGIENEALVECLRGLTHLKHLGLSRVPSTDDSALAALAEAAHGLQSLDITRCSAVTDTGIAALAKSCPGLRALTLDYVHQVSDEGLDALARSCRQLTSLSLGRCARITEVALVRFLSEGPAGIERLSLNHVGPAAGHACAQALVARHARTLRELDVSWCRGMDDACLGTIADACGKLEHLRMFGCPQVTPRMLNGHSNDGLRITGVQA